MTNYILDATRLGVLDVVNGIDKARKKAVKYAKETGEVIYLRKDNIFFAIVRKGNMPGTYSYEEVGKRRRIIKSDGSLGYFD